MRGQAGRWGELAPAGPRYAGPSSSLSIPGRKICVTATLILKALEELDQVGQDLAGLLVLYNP